MIVTPDRRLRVFVSSTLDLTEERAAARRAIESLNLTPVMFEAGARAHPPRALYRSYVEQSDVFVAIYSSRYGWVAPGSDVSGLEDEFDLSAHKPRLVYVRRGVEREPRLDALLARVREGGLSYKPFASAQDLETSLKDDLVVLLTERFQSSERNGASGPRRPAPLPAPLGPLVGRDAELDEVTSLLVRDDVRLVTLLGPGGIGKTRLAVEAARRLGRAFDGRAFFVSLEALRDPRLVAETVAAALDVRANEYPAVTAVAEFLEDRPALLVLDNFEQVVDAAPSVAELLAACPQLSALVTSRAPLRVRGEHELEVGPLALPPATLRPGDEAAFSAVLLFVEAARAVRPGFALDASSAAAVAELCRLLDGIPLAIEMAAALVRVLTPAMILDRLRDHVTDVAVTARDRPERHRKLADTIAWSYDLLDPPGKDLFAQLSVFRGGFDVASAESVCVVECDVLEGIASLAEQSLVRADVGSAPGPRFSMLETIREFAWGRLGDHPRRDDVLDRHAHAFVRLAETIGAPGRRPDPRDMDTFEVELDNLRSAFEWFLTRRDPDPLADALWDSWWFWWMRGCLVEGRIWADRCLATPGIARRARGRALAARAMFALWSGEYEVAASAFPEAVELATEGGDVRTRAYARIGEGLVRAVTGSIAEGTSVIRRGIAEFEDVGDDAGAATGFVALAWIQGITRRFDETDAVIREALERAQDIGADVEVGIAEAALAQFLIERGDTAAVPDLLGRALERLARARDIGSTILTLEVIAEVGLAAGLAEEAGKILGATNAVRAAAGTRVPPDAAARLERLTEAARSALGPRFDAVWATGSDLGFSDAAEEGHALLASYSAAGSRRG